QVARRLMREGKEHRADVPMGIMVEVPRTAMTADHFARECAFFAIGTNDLLQYLLAIDRTNERVDYLYHPLDPSVLRTLRMICTAAGEAGIPVSVCGEMAGDPQHTPILLALNVHQLSMNAGAIPRVKRLVRELRKADCDELLTDALACVTHDEVSGLVQRFLNDRSSQRIEASAEDQDE
ncbi:MAG: phosphoenolpyruvate--protein phosphotransferase, partial [Deltaproteobacteria bacterium]|nr:phosphoenolpyruvate--protein phosphotransferase [Deltaproteobacteria bacterium]